MAPKAVFGRRLQDAFADCGGPPPAFRDTLRWLSSRGLRVPDLLSSPPDVRKVELLRRAWDQGQSPLRFTGDAVAVAGSLRLWLACLPEPVLPARLYHPLLAASSLEGGPTRVRALQSLLRQAGTEALQVLFPLLEFLHHYQLNQRAAKRPPADVGRLFAPALLRPPPSAGVPASTTPGAPPPPSPAAVSFVEALVVEYRTVFSKQPPPPRPGVVAAEAAAAAAAVVATPPPPASPSPFPPTLAATPSPSPFAAPAWQEQEVAEQADDFCIDSMLSGSLSGLLFEEGASAAATAAAARPARAHPAATAAAALVAGDATAAAAAKAHAAKPGGNGHYTTHECSGGSSAGTSGGGPSPLDSASPATSSDGGSAPASPPSSPDLLLGDCCGGGDPMDCGGGASGAASPRAAAAAATAATALATLAPPPSLGYTSAPVASMPLEAVLREKAALKAGLAAAAAAHARGTGRSALGRAERDALRPLFLRYWKLRRAVRRRAAGGADVMVA